ncbi:MAG: pyridoxal phosphate-dependent aminotransferase [Muribaculaceae bacterium]|nr:pyridoxal phosphate-dependent aminotransferase [Muribaculaceae bacterium]
MKKYDFDEVIDRHGSGCTKIDDLRALFGKDDLTPLWIADMDFKVCPDITEALQQRISHPIYGYSRPTDTYWSSIIDWLDRRHGFKVEREELTYVPGVVKGIAFAINYFTCKGDKIVIQPPVYHPFKMVIEGNERELVTNPLRWTGSNYEMNLEELERIFAEEHPKMMIVCNPHNPIGLQWSRETLAEVGRLCRKYGVLVISDEIHGDLMLGGRTHFPFADCGEDAAAVSITFGAPSKTFNIPGLVSSWCVIKNPEIRDPFFHWLEVNEFNATTFVSTIGAESAYTHGEEWLGEVVEYIEGNLDALEGYLAERLPDVKMVRPEASFLVWMDFNGLNLSHDELVDLVVNHAGLALNDGEMFGPEGHGFMRVNVATPRKSLFEAMDKLEKACRELVAQS